MKSIPSTLIILAVSFTAFSCGKNSGSGVNLVSPGYNATSLAGAPAWLRGIANFAVPEATAAVTAVKGFKFCITQLKLSGSDGGAITDSSGKSLLEAKLGVIDLGDGSAPKTWGNLALPEGVAISRVAVEVHKDPELCGGATYSAQVTDNNGTVSEITKDLEFKFRFTNARALSSGDTVSLALSTLIGKIEQAVLSNNFTDQNIGNYLDGSFEDEAK